jgi:EmrB/QacA subfamily drug resistance transporter
MSVPPEQLPDGLAAKSKYIALIAMLLAVAMTFIDQTVIAVATPNIQQELGLSRDAGLWVINGYLLALAAGFAFGGRLADVLGHKRTVLAGIIGFAVTSALCGAAPSGAGAEAWIVSFRVLQGLSGALMIPAALAIVVSSFRVSERGKALAIFFGVSGGLTSIGPFAGGYLVQWTWRSIFWINVPIAILAIIVTLRAGIVDRPVRQRIDYRGAAIIAAGMALSVLGLQQATSWGWADVRTIGGIGARTVLLVIFALIQLRTAHPLIRVRIFADRAFVVDNAVLFLSMVAFVPVFFFASVYAQLSLGDSASEAGLYLLTFFAGFAPAAQIGGRMLDSGGAKKPVLLGCGIGAVGFALWARAVPDLDFGGHWYWIVLAGAGIGLLLGPVSTDATNRAIDASYGEVTGITQTVRNYGSSLGLAVLGTLLTGVFTSRLTDSFVGLGQSRDAARGSAEQVADLGGGSSSSSLDNVPEAFRAQVLKAIQLDFAYATRAVLIGMAVALVLAFLVALAHPGTRVLDPAEATDAESARDVETGQSAPS